MVQAGFVVIGAGGGGIPVVLEGQHLRGVEAVIDKDLSAALLAKLVDADVLLVATDVPNVVLRFGTPEAEPLGKVTVSQLRELRRRGPLRQRVDGPQGRCGLPLRRAWWRTRHDHQPGQHHPSVGRWLRHRRRT